MTVISAPNEMLFPSNCRGASPSTALSKEVPCNHCNLVAISTFVRGLKNSLQRPIWHHVVRMGLFDWMTTVKLDDFRVLQQPEGLELYAVKNSLRTANLVSRGWKGAI